MKKFLAVLLLAAMVLTFVGCGNKDVSKQGGENATVNYSVIDTGIEKINEKELEKKDVTRNDGMKEEQYKDSESGNLKEIVIYNEKGKADTYKQFEYNEDGRIVAQKQFDGGKNFKSATAYEYDGDRLMRIYYYNADGSLNYYEDRTYDADGNIISAPLIDAEGNTLANPEFTKPAKKAETTAKAENTSAAKTPETTVKGN